MRHAHFSLCNDRRYKAYEYTADGALASHGFNSYKKRGVFPEMTQTLWAAGYGESATPQNYDRCNALLRLPSPDVGCWPPMALVNRSNGITQAWQRPEADCVPLAPFDGSFGKTGFAFAPSITTFNGEHTEAAQPARIFRLLEVVCKQTGAPLNVMVLDTDQARASFDEFQLLLNPKKEKSKAAGKRKAVGGDDAGRALGEPTEETGARREEEEDEALDEMDTEGGEEEEQAQEMNLADQEPQEPQGPEPPPPQQQPPPQPPPPQQQQQAGRPKRSGVEYGTGRWG